MKISVPTPRSLSVATILKLGKVVKSNTTLVQLYSFDIESLSWSNVPVPVEFEISLDILGEGGFQKAYKATTSTKGYAGKIWVVKRYKKEALSVIEEIGQTVEDQVKKVWINYGIVLQILLDFSSLLEFGHPRAGHVNMDLVKLLHFDVNKYLDGGKMLWNWEGCNVLPVTVKRRNYHHCTLHTKGLVSSRTRFHN